MLDLEVPHGFNMMKGVGIGDGKAENHDVRPSKVKGKKEIR